MKMPKLYVDPLGTEAAFTVGTKGGVAMYFNLDEDALGPGRMKLNPEERVALRAHITKEVVRLYNLGRETELKRGKR